MRLVELRVVVASLPRLDSSDRRDQLGVVLHNFDVSQLCVFVLEGEHMLFGRRVLLELQPGLAFHVGEVVVMQLESLVSQPSGPRRIGAACYLSSDSRCWSLFIFKFQKTAKLLISNLAFERV